MFSIEGKVRRSHFFEKTFLLVDISMNITFGMSFFILSNVEIDFMSCHIYGRIYIDVEVLLTIQQIKLIGEKKFVTDVLNVEKKAFVVHIAFINQDSDIDPS